MSQEITAELIAEKIDALKVGERFALSHVPDQLYFESEGIGSTAMKEATKSMAHYHAYQTDNTVYSPATQKAFAVGHAAHCLVLEPELYEQRFVIQPDSIKTRRGKKWDEFKEQNEGLEILTKSDSKQVVMMAEAIIDNCGQFFCEGDSEKSYWYRHESGMILKARIDHELGDGIVDLKTAYVDDPRKFSNKVKYDYDIQDAHYRMVSGLADMVYIGVGKTAPYTTYLCKQGADIRLESEQKIESAIKGILFADEVGKYPNAPVELIETHYTSYELERIAS